MRPLKLLEPLYHLISEARNFAYDLKWVKQVKLSVPVVSVGNLSFGGVGKTPCIAMLAEDFSPFMKVAIVSRSYGAPLTQPTRVNLHEPKAPAKFGDEPCLLQHILPQCEVWAGPNKAETATAAAVRAGLILVDDGFSHRRLFRNFDLVLVDATQAFDTYLREPKSNLRRADAVMITKGNLVAKGRTEQIAVEIEKIAPALRGSIFHSGVETVLSFPKTEPVFLFCGIGNPQSLVLDLEKNGYSVAGKMIFPDHHGYTGDDQKRIFAKYSDLKNEMRGLKLVTTEKDFVKLTDSDVLKHAVATKHRMVMEPKLKEVLIGKIRKSF